MRNLELQNQLAVAARCNLHQLVNLTLDTKAVYGPEQSRDAMFVELLLDCLNVPRKLNGRDTFVGAVHHVLDAPLTREAVVAQLIMFTQALLGTTRFDLH